ncbi:hypothetical protein [Haladaptatus sp. CMAA 1911]|uniref:hypothetical protein n=1 Tax=unclassified Haladaptatus TaxID=2622732 RepID=UPI003754FBE6
MKTLINEIDSQQHSIWISCVTEYYSLFIPTISGMKNTEENIGEKCIPYSEEKQVLDSLAGGI